MKRIFIVDDHAVFRRGIRHLLMNERDLEICGDAGSLEEAFALIEETKPDLVICDLSLSGRNGLELIKDLQPRCPALPVLVASMHDELLYAERVLKAGGRGYLMKDHSENLLPAIRTVLSGEIYVSPAVQRRFRENVDWGVRNQAVHPLSLLSDRELEVFELIGHGKANGEIAARLRISQRTVDAHRVNIREKLGLSDGTGLLRLAVRWVESGKVESPPP